MYPLCLILIPEPHTMISEVRRILDLQSKAYEMPDAFFDLTKVTRSYIPAANLPVRIDVPVGRKVIPEGCNVPVGRVVPDGRCTTWRLTSHMSLPEERWTIRFKGFLSPEEGKFGTNESFWYRNLNRSISLDYPDFGSVPEETTLGDAPTSKPTSENKISNHACSEIWNRNEIIIDDTFVFMVATKIKTSDDIEPYSVDDFPT
jgi:hypothetical protein